MVSHNYEEFQSTLFVRKTQVSFLNNLKESYPELYNDIVSLCRHEQGKYPEPFDLIVTFYKEVANSVPVSIGNGDDFKSFTKFVPHDRVALSIDDELEWTTANISVICS